MEKRNDANVRWVESKFEKKLETWGIRKTSKSIVMDGVKIGKFGKSDDSDILEERRNREEKQFCNLSNKGFARHHRERHKNAGDSRGRQSTSPVR